MSKQSYVYNVEALVTPSGDITMCNVQIKAIDSIYFTFYILLFYQTLILWEPLLDFSIWQHGSLRETGTIENTTD